MAAAGRRESEQYFLTVYERLGVTLTEADFAGESFYNDDARPPSSTSSTRLGLLQRERRRASASSRAGFTGRDGEPLPLIVRKRDGGYGYGATDLAAIRHRTQDLRPTRLLYVVGLAAAPAPRDGLRRRPRGRLARAAGPGRARRVRLGPRRGRQDAAQPRPATPSSWSTCSTRRSTGPPRWSREKNPDLDAATRADVAQRRRDRRDQVRRPVQRPDQGLRLRLGSDALLRRQHRAVPAVRARPDPVDLPQGRGHRTSGRPGRRRRSTPAERALALELLGFPELVGPASPRPWSSTGSPATCTGWPTAFTAFYERCPVLKAEEPTRRSRLVLCDLTARTLATGLDLLGITAPNQM